MGEKVAALTAAVMRSDLLHYLCCCCGQEGIPLSAALPKDGFERIFPGCIEMSLIRIQVDMPGS